MQSAQKCGLGVSASFSLHFYWEKRDGYFEEVAIFAEIQTIRSNCKLHRLPMKCKD